tara:strand:- start:244 stop:789 length:546 start_codon:yes stop_codon:yes gene_type:complete
MTSTALRIFNYCLTYSFLPATALIFFFTVGCQPQILESKAPFFTITTYETEFYEKGNLFELDSNSEKPTVINFWFPSCPPCVKEMPDIDSVYRLYKDQVDVVGVQMIGLDSVSDGSDFVRKAAIGYAVGPDEDGSIAVNYGVTGFPTTIFVDSERQIFKSWQGEIKSEQLKKILDTLVRIK